MASRTPLYTAFALAVTFWNLLLSFKDRNLGMQGSTKALLNISTHIKTLQDMDVADSLPCADTVRKSIVGVCELQRENLRPFVRKPLNTGGAVTSDRLI